MSVRVSAITGVCVDGSGAPNPTGTVSLKLLIPGGGLAIDTAGELINRDPPNPTPDPITAVWTANIIPPGDITPPGCEWQVTLGSVQPIVSPSFAYVAGPINVTSWISSPSRLGLVKMYLTAVEANALADTGATFGVTINTDSIWTGTGGSGELIQAGAPPITTVVDSGGDVFYYLIPQASLNPSDGYYQTPTRRQALYFTCPAAYTGDAGTYAAGTTYAADAVVRDPANNYEPYISLSGGNIGHTPNSSPSFWAVYRGESITAHETVPEVPGTRALSMSGIRFGNRTLTGAAVTLTSADDFVALDATAANQVTTLPDITTWPGKPLYIKRIDATANTETLTPVAGQTVNGAATLAITTAGGSLTLVPLGLNWSVF